MSARRTAAAVMLAVTYAGSAVANAEPTLIKCPDNTHVWNKEQCDNHNTSNPFGGIPGSSGNEGGSGGLIGFVRDTIGRLL